MLKQNIGFDHFLRSFVTVIVLNQTSNLKLKLLLL